MHFPTILAAFSTLLILAVHAAPATIHVIKSFRAASHETQNAFLLALDPLKWTHTTAELAKIAKQPRVAKLLEGHQAGEGVTGRCRCGSTSRG
ncbi:hypothetical protein C8R46DRAFT_1235627 [Mycena filopes]|nr:hypothetical protein C8R46DRAFT_1235627 [Mycena filopes]